MSKETPAGKKSQEQTLGGLSCPSRIGQHTTCHLKRPFEVEAYKSDRVRLHRSLSVFPTPAQVLYPVSAFPVAHTLAATLSIH